MEYEFHFVVDGISVTDDEAVGIVHETFDGLLTCHRGRHFLDVSENGADAIDAAHRIVVRLRKALPALRLLRTDPDLVGVTDIAERVGRSRQNIQQWVNGERRQDKRPFPDPEGMAGRSPVWRWGDVNAWLTQFGEGDDVHAPTREEALHIDFELPKWQRSLDDGLPIVHFAPAVTGDGCDGDREMVQRLLEGTLALPGVLPRISSFQRWEQQRLTVVCAVLTDRLDRVVARIGHDETWAVLAFQGAESELHLQPLGRGPAPGGVPVSTLGLGRDATVGDLLLVQSHGPDAAEASLKPVVLD
ncbi:helix-turn-helix transcriptional regulator [Streptomyces sp. NPDC056638]|uniref:helix-turn-helix transcriptional regulator n=1 Tax=Streptomyces sp. NPDC056638 TaxID=3345887 RepID=UPI00369D8405